MRTGDEQAIHAIEQAIGARVKRLEGVAGGMICRAGRVDTDVGPLFAKWRVGAPDGFFAAEAHGLLTLRAARALRVPEVIAAADSSVGPSVLVLEYIRTEGA